MSELWKECANWLARSEILPDNHRIMWPDAEVADLAYTLRDGVLLCHLAIRLDPESIDMKAVNLRPQMAQFLCLKNIRLFLKACSTSFGIKETDLFSPQMLYDYTDFMRVLHTLSKVSNCVKSKANLSGVEGFPRHQAQLSQQEEQIYRTLEDVVTEDNYREFNLGTYGASNAYGYGRTTGQNIYGCIGDYATNERIDEDIYEDLCTFKDKKFQAQVLDIQPKEKRDYCIKELVETEGKYVEVLNTLRKNFIKTINSIKDQDKAVIFMNITDLGDVHASFYKSLFDAVSGKSSQRLGDIFLENKERLLKYGEYCSRLPLAQEKLDFLSNKDERFREELARCEMEANEGKFRLRDLLTVPMQRILKYHLLLQQLLKATDLVHEEYNSIQRAYEAMLDVSDYVNEVKRDSEQLGVIKEIQMSITDWNMPPGVELKDYGRLRKDSELKVQSHDNATGGGKTKLRYVFVFDKVMIMCKAARNDHYTYKHSLKLSEYRVQDNPQQRRTLLREAASSRWSHSFILGHVDQANAYTMYAKTEDDKNKWIAAINEALNNIFPVTFNVRRSLGAGGGHSGHHEVIMYTFERPTSCAYCHKMLKGLFYQGYKCERCQRPFHKECIALFGKCGGPPELQPRPISMQLPMSNNNRLSTMSNDGDESGVDRSSTLSHRTSSASMHSTKTPTMPRPPLNFSLSTLTLTNGNPDYINTNMEEHTWFVGEMDRNKANTTLALYPVFTFLVRCRVQNGERVGYALSLKTPDDVKHMKIQSTAPLQGNDADLLGHQTHGSMLDDIALFYLSETRKFRSIVELVTYYSRNSLKESFTGLDASLSFSIGELSIVEAAFDFAPNPAEQNMLPLNKGDRVVVVDKVGDAQGWWKAFNNFRVGFIPKEFVVVVSQVRNPVIKDDNESVVTDTTTTTTSVASNDLNLGASKQDVASASLKEAPVKTVEA